MSNLAGDMIARQTGRAVLDGDATVDDLADSIINPPTATQSASVAQHFRTFQAARMRALIGHCAKHGKELLANDLARVHKLFATQGAQPFLRMPHVANALARLEVALVAKNFDALEEQLREFEAVSLPLLALLDKSYVGRTYNISATRIGLWLLGADLIFLADHLSGSWTITCNSQTTFELRSSRLSIPFSAKITDDVIHVLPQLRQHAVEGIRFLPVTCLPNSTIGILPRSPFTPQQLQNPVVEDFLDLDLKTVANLSSGLSCIRELQPSYLTDLECFTRYILPLDWTGRRDEYVGGSSSYYYGILTASPYTLSGPSAPLRTAEILIHENHHTKFTSLADPWGGLRHPIVEQPSVNIPWKRSARPLLAAIDGFYVHVVVLAFLESIRNRTDDPFLQRRVVELHYLIGGAVSVLSQHSKLLEPRLDRLWNASLVAARALGVPVS